MCEGIKPIYLPELLETNKYQIVSFTSLLKLYWERRSFDYSSERHPDAKKGTGNLYADG